MSRDVRPRQILFDHTAEIFATDSGGGFFFPLLADGESWVDTGDFDEIRFTFSIWSPASSSTPFDMDRCYAEMRGRLDPEEEHWTKLSEVEPVVSPYGGGETFDGWLLLPVLGERSSFALGGGGFGSRTRLQIRASAFLVP